MRSNLCLCLLLLLAACDARNKFPPGGYAYPEIVADKDTNYYFYPVRNRLSKRDSIEAALVFESYHALDEPNLSLKPMSTEVYRLVYGEALNMDITIISLTPTEIVAKLGKATDEIYQLPDTIRLDTLERRLVRLLVTNYPLDRKNPKMSARKRKFLDSMGTRYPQLYDPSYYLSLLKKEFTHSKPIFTYTEKRIPISSADYKHLVDGLTTSGFWHLPPTCPQIGEVVDGSGITLEANTVDRYNMVRDCACMADTSQFKHACQELVKYAGLQEKIHLYSDHPYKVVIDSSGLKYPDVQEPGKSKPKKLKTPHPN
jgi:hypothetical protein